MGCGQGLVHLSFCASGLVGVLALLVLVEEMLLPPLGEALFALCPL